ncbi:MAG: STAS domain-containing protein [Acidimicrobiales bacterium]
MDPTFRISESGPWTVLHVHGEIDMASAPAVRRAVVDLVGGGIRWLVLDLGDVGFVDSTGLGVLVGALKRVTSAAGEMTVVCGRENILELFRMTRLTAVFAIYDDVASACERVPSSPDAEVPPR